MKISIDRIKKEGKVELEYEDNQFQKTDLRESTKGPLNIKISLVLVGNDNVAIKGEIKGDFVLICDRCCDEFVQHKDFKLDEIFELDKKELTERMIDIDTKIRDVVLNSFPIKILCKEDCRGICTGCGVNLNKEECRCKQK